MKRFLDASILVEACLTQSPRFSAADALVNGANGFTSTHALAEAYATLSGDPRLRLKPAEVAEMVDGLAACVRLQEISAADYRKVIASAPANGIRGGMIYDALHAEAARKCGCTQLHTMNVSHFKLVAPDLSVVGL